jgi:outer membrane receptor protein involved in Fe transport
VKSNTFKAALRGHSAMIAAGALAASLTTTAAWAQDAPPPQPDEATVASTIAGADTAEGAIIVTGTRISRPDLKSTVPISIVTGDSFIRQGNSNVGDALNDFPQLRATRGQQNSNLGVGISGLNLLDLRGLGTQRTLVLVDGRRHVAADVLSNGVSVDINTIQANLIERVDIVTGSNSAVYGSDAIAGVANFILKRNFEGLEVGAKATVSTPGSYGFNWRADAIYGKNFADGRGNITISAEYSHQNRVYASDVPWARRADGFVINDLDPAGLPNGSDGVPDRLFQTDIRSSTINVRGLVPISYSNATAQCGTGVSNGVTPGTPYSCTYIFNADGTLVPQTGTRLGQGPNATILGGNGQTGREGVLFTAFPKQDLFNINILGRYEFSEAFELFWEGKYSRIVSTGGNAGPAGIQGQFAQFDLRERFRLDNPFLNPAARATIQSQILASGCNNSFIAACTGARTTFGGQGVGGALTAADIAQLNDGSYRFVIGRNLIEQNSRDERFLRQTYRGVLGLRGTFNDDWRYEVSFNYGRFTENTNASGYLDRQRFLLSLDAGRNPTTNAIECRAKFDPAAQIAFPNNAANQARLAADIAACVPYNPFGAQDNSAAVNYFSVNYRNNSWITQMDISGHVAGDTSGFLNFPGGPVSFVFGGEYRREDSRYSQDPFAAAGNTNAVAFGTFDPDVFKVKEAFGEVRAAIFRDRPLLEELSIAGAARVADYNSGAGTVWAWNVGGDYSPTPGLRFRANYGKSVRAPNLSETSSPLVPNFAPGFADPCSANRIGSGTQFRGANCLADVGALLPNITNVAYSLGVLSGSNPNLRSEVGKSLTVGAIVQPSFIPGLTLTVDYFNIQVDGVIVSLNAQTIANSCYDQPDLNNVFCTLFQRVRSGVGPQGEVAGNIQNNTLIQAPANFAKRVRRGLDTQLTYNFDISDIKFRTDLLWVHTFKNSNFENPTLPNFENRLKDELGDPADEFRFRADISKGAFTFGYELRYIGPQYINTFEDFNQLQERPPQDGDYSLPWKYPEVFYHDIRFEWDWEKSGIAKNILFYAGVDNLTNVTPPLGLTGTGERMAGGGNGSPIYSVRGRQLYAGFRAKF